MIIKILLLLIYLLLIFPSLQLEIKINVYPAINYSILTYNFSIYKNNIEEKYSIENIGSLPATYYFIHEIYKDNSLYSLIKTDERNLNPGEFGSYDFKYFFFLKGNYTIKTKIFYFSNIEKIDEKNILIQENCNKSDLIIYAIKFNKGYYIKIKDKGLLILRNENTLKEKVIENIKIIKYCSDEDLNRVIANVKDYCDEKKIKEVSLIEFVYFQIFETLSYILNFLNLIV